MDSPFKRHARMYGNDGKKWLNNIPSIIRTYEMKWALRVLPPFNLSYNYIAPAIRSDGSQAVLKIGYPKDVEFQSEIDMLLLCQGQGIVQLIEEDRKNSVILIEKISPGTPLSTLTDDTQATKILASVAKTIWKPIPEGKRFTHISEWAHALYEYPKNFQNHPNPPIPIDTARKALRLLEGLLKTSAPEVLTHADLHHDNILKSDRHGWVAIDPKGIAAEPCFDTTAMLRNPYARIHGMKNIDGILKNRIHILSQELGFDPKRIRRWCFVQTVLSGIWTSEDKGDTAHALKVAASLDRI